ncbi:glycoside hydrolase domain-containing protein [Phocaeicola sp.]
MKNIYLICLLFIISACGTPAVEDQITFTQVDPFLKIFRESNFFPEYNATAEVAAGEHATFQFAVRAGLPLKELSAQVTAFTNEKGETLQSAPRTGFVDYVRVGRQTPDRAKDAISPLSHYYPDPIIEKNNRSVARDVAQPVWISVPIPADAQAGTYKATFSLKGKAGDEAFDLKKEISIEVYPVVMPQPELWVTNWFSTSPEKMKTFNSGKEVEPYSDAYWAMVGELAGKLKECYSNVILISPLEHIGFSEKDGVYTFDYTQFDKIINIFHQAGVLKMLEGGHIAGRTGNWDSRFAPYVPEYENGKKKLVQYPMNSEKAQNFYRQFLPSLTRQLKKEHPDVLYAQHIADEPIASNIKSYVDIARFVKQQCPDIKIIEACHSHDLENTLDIWVPQLNFYKDGYDFYRERQKQGDEVWFYTCLAPQGDFANRFLEQPLIKTRLIHWLNFKYGATGYLHWGFNYWLADPYKETTTMNQEGGNTLPGGDSWIVYPDHGKLYGSIRLEAMRDGIADYTLLKMLEKKNPELAKELCRLVVFHWTLYDTEGDHFRSIRHQILEELSK